MGMEYKEPIIKVPENKKNISFGDIKNEWLRIGLNENDLINIFNKKYSNNENFHGTTLLDEDGQPVKTKDEKRVLFTSLEDVNDFDKARHMRGLFKMFNENTNDYVNKLSKETATLDLFEEKGSNIKDMINEYMKNAE